MAKNAIFDFHQESYMVSLTGKICFTTPECILASSRNVRVSFCPDAQNHVGRADEIRNQAFSHPILIMWNPKARFKIPARFDWMQERISSPPTPPRRSAVSMDVEGSMYQYAKDVGITLMTITHRCVIARPPIGRSPTRLLIGDPANATCCLCCKLQITPTVGN